MEQIIKQFIIPLNPVPKKNNSQIAYNKYTGKAFIVPSAAYKKYASEAAWFMPMLQEPISAPVNVRCLFYRKDNRRCDLTNLLEAIDDIMVEAGVIADDNYHIIAGHDGSRVFVDKEDPRTKVFIETF